MNIRTLLMLPVLFLALAISLGGGFALADGAEDGRDHEADELEITYSWSPRFPIAGEDAECIITVLHEGSPVQGLPVSITLEQVEGHGHGGETDDHDEAGAHDEADEHTEGDDHDADAETHDDAGTHDEADEHTEGDDHDADAETHDDAGTHDEADEHTEGGDHDADAETHDDAGTHDEADEHTEGDDHDADAETHDDAGIHDETDEHTEGDDHDADAETHDDAGTHDEADEHTEGDDHDSADGTIDLIATEIEPGIYVIRTAFAQNGSYAGTIQIADQQMDIAASVRSGAVAWPLLMVFAGIPALLACGVAITKTVRKRW